MQQEQQRKFERDQEQLAKRRIEEEKAEALRNKELESKALLAEANKEEDDRRLENDKFRNQVRERSSEVRPPPRDFGVRDRLGAGGNKPKKGELVNVSDIQAAGASNLDNEGDKDLAPWM